MKRILAFVLCVLLLGGALCGCGDKEAAQLSDRNAPETEPEEDTARNITDAAPEGLCYEPTVLSQPDAGSVDAQCVWNGRVYSACNRGTPAVCWADADGNGAELTLPAECEMVFDVCAAGEQVAVLAGTHGWLESDGEEGAKESAILLYDGADELAGTLPLEADCADGRILIWQNGAFYLASASSLFALDEGGGIRAVNEANYRIIVQLAEAADGLYCLVFEHETDEKTVLLRLDAELSELARLDVTAYDVQGLGRDADGGVLLLTNEDILRPDLQTGGMTRVLSWADNLNLTTNNYQSVILSTEGLFVCQSGTAAARYYARLGEGETLDEPEELTVFSFDVYPTALEACITAFTSRYPQYRIRIEQPEMVDMGAYEAMDPDQLVEQAELTTGAGADLYYFPTDSSGWTDMDDTAVFEDLLPRLETDSDGLLEDVVPCVEKLLTGNGALYRLPLGYFILTYVAEGSAVTDRTPAGVLAACDADGAEAVPFDWVSGMYLSQAAQVCARDYVDTQSWTCHFTDESFLDQLRLLKRQMPNGIPEESEAVEINEGGLLGYYNISGARVIRYNPELFLHGALENPVFTGYPSVSESRGFLSQQYVFALNANSTHKDAAWAFLKFLLSEEFQTEEFARYPLPLRDSALRAQFPALVADGTITQTDIDTFYALAASVEPEGYPADAVIALIEEEVTTYLSGGADEQTTAARIQSRVGLLLQERFG